LRDPTVLLSKKYKTKTTSFDSYKKLCIADSLKLFRKSIEQMKNINFNIKIVDLTAKVNYMTFDIVFHYNSRNNEIVIVDLQ